MPAFSEGVTGNLHGYYGNSGRHGHDCQRRSPCLSQPVEPVRYKELDGRGKRPADYPITSRGSLNCTATM
jgi:hypothetical protein